MHRFEENLYLGKEGRNICKILGKVQYVEMLPHLKTNHSSILSTKWYSIHSNLHITRCVQEYNISARA